MSYTVLTKSHQAILRQARRDRHLSQRGLAERTGISVNTIRRIEHSPVPQVQELKVITICDALGLSSTSFVEGGRFDAINASHEASLAQEIGTFVAAPMAAAGSRYERWRVDILKVVARVRAVSTTPVFCALEELRSKDRFEDEAIALTGNLRRLGRSKRLLAIYPGKIVSSVLVEIGIALGLYIPTLVLVRDRSNLPWMLQGHSVGSPPYRVVRYRDISDLCSMIENEERDWFA